VPDSYKPLLDPPDIIPGILKADAGTITFFRILPSS